MKKTFEEINQGLFDNIKLLKGRITEVEKKIERLEERYIDEEVSKDLYEKHSAKYKQEEKEINKELQKLEEQTSNFDGCIDIAVATASRLGNLWEESDYNMKQKLQNLVFPEGVLYNKKNGQCRTTRVNFIFEIIACISGLPEKK